jgi:hypothetical protein
MQHYGIANPLDAPPLTHLDFGEVVLSLGKMCKPGLFYQPTFPSLSYRAFGGPGEAAPLPVVQRVASACSGGGGGSSREGSAQAATRRQVNTRVC